MINGFLKQNLTSILKQNLTSIHDQWSSKTKSNQCQSMINGVSKTKSNVNP